MTGGGVPRPPAPPPHVSVIVNASLNQDQGPTIVLPNTALLNLRDASVTESGSQAWGHLGIDGVFLSSRGGHCCHFPRQHEVKAPGGVPALSLESLLTPALVSSSEKGVMGIRPSSPACEHSVNGRTGRVLCGRGPVLITKSL